MGWVSASEVRRAAHGAAHRVLGMGVWIALPAFSPLAVQRSKTMRGVPHSRRTCVITASRASIIGGVLEDASQIQRKIRNQDKASPVF